MPLHFLMVYGGWVPAKILGWSEQDLKTDKTGLVLWFLIKPVQFDFENRSVFDKNRN
jgi:hypothetical protein